MHILGINQSSHKIWADPHRMVYGLDDRYGYRLQEKQLSTSRRRDAEQHNCDHAGMPIVLRGACITCGLNMSKG